MDFFTGDQVMKSDRLSILLLGVAIFGLCLSAWGQATTSLRGAVTDSSGAAIPGANVTLTNTSTNVERHTITNERGSYDFVSVLPGPYKISVSAKGFREYVQSGLQLMVNLPASQNVQLQVGATSQTVEVSGVAPQLNTTDASVGNTMGTNAIENLPLQGQSMPLLLSFQPGVVYNGDKLLEDNYDTRAGMVNGERSDQNNITLDGVSDNDEFEGYAFNGVLPTTPFSVQEFRVTTSNSDATQARSAGAQIAMVTKGGTNNWHGTLYEDNRNDLGEANDWFLKRTQLADNQPNRPGKLIRNVFGGTLGGPIKKNRFFFFFNYQGTRLAQAATSIVRTIPTDTLRDGIIQYKCANAAQCPGGSVTGVSGKSYTIDPGYYGIGPAQLAQMDPLGIGPSKVALAYFNTYAHPNDFSVRDGHNYAGYRFAAPTGSSANWYIGRLDYKLTESGNHTLFLRGTAVDDSSNSAPFQAGGAPMYVNKDLSKGLVAGYTAVLSPHLVNSFRYGLTRQSLGTNGNSTQPWVYMRSMDQNISRTSSSVTPVHNFVENLSWSKGKHNLQFGANIALIRRKSMTYGTSFSDTLLNADWIEEGGFAGKNDALDPAAAGLPAVASTFTNSYDFPLAGMMGIASEIDARYNYFVNSATSATPMDQGAPLIRHWATDTYDLYANDTWQLLPNLSITAGINYQLMTPVTETAGQEVIPNINMGMWFQQRTLNMLQGIGSNQDPIVQFAPGGSVWGKSGLYSAQTKNFAPRFGIAWTPRANGGLLGRLLGNDQTVVHAGFGMYYGNFGPELATTFDQVGAFGLSASLQNPAGSLPLADAPRITSMNVIPTTDANGNPLMPAAPSSSFPVTYTGVRAIARGIDQSLKTPYSYAMNLSIQRSLPGHITLDIGYVGHMGHRLLVYSDIATPGDVVDPKSGIDYFTAATRLSEMARQGIGVVNGVLDPNAITASVIGPTAAYWQDMIAPKATYGLWSQAGAPTSNMLASVYDMFRTTVYNETTGLYRMDVNSAFYKSRNVPTFVTGYNTFYDNQYSSLYVWRSQGWSNYHALQVGLHKQMTNGVLFGFNYTWSHAMDVESMAERGVRHNDKVIINPWDLRAQYGPSDADLRHQINAYWVVDLPVGRGKYFANNIGKAADAVIGGWQVSGTSRWTSGYNASVLMGYVWPTNWEEMGNANAVGPIPTGGSNTNGVPNVFTNPQAGLAAFDYAYPGQAGTRNPLRGDGFIDWDMSLAKSWQMPWAEGHTLQFRWNVFNVANSHRFDIRNGAQLEADVNSFGNYTSTLTQPRVMEYQLVYRF
jgi:hypothetical protein